RDGTLALGDLCYAEGLLALAVMRYAEHGATTLSRARRLNCAEAYLALDRVDEAVATLDAVDADGESRYHLLRARVARQRADSNAARASWQRALELDPLAGEAMMGLGVLHLETGSLDRAGFYFERASRTPSHRLGALVQLAQLAVERQEYEDAVKRLEEAIDRGAGRLVERYLARIRRLAALGD
ncbi:MAG: tetratricopeptide repeat protein, partial [Planctomycetota bacterium]